MYDEVTRQQDHYWESYMYVQEEGCGAGRAIGIEEGRTPVLKLGIEQGIELAKEQERNMLISLIK